MGKLSLCDQPLDGSRLTEFLTLRFVGDRTVGSEKDLQDKLDSLHASHKISSGNACITTKLCIVPTYEHPLIPHIIASYQSPLLLWPSPSSVVEWEPRQLVGPGDSLLHCFFLSLCLYV